MGRSRANWRAFTSCAVGKSKFSIPAKRAPNRRRPSPQLHTMGRAALALAVGLIVTGCAALATPQERSIAAGSLDEPEQLVPSAGAHRRELTELEVLPAWVGFHVRRLWGVASEDTVVESAVGEGVRDSLDPTVDRFRQYVSTISPAIYATYTLVGVLAFLLTFCLTCAFCVCCSVALLPYEICANSCCPCLPCL